MNDYRMRAFHLASPDEALFVTQPVSQIPWGLAAFLDR